MKDQFSILEKIETVEAPPFLLTRIQTKIQQQLEGRVSKKQAVLYVAGLIIIVVLNVLVISSNKKTQTSNDLVTEMNLLPSNQLYQ